MAIILLTESLAFKVYFESKKKIVFLKFTKLTRGSISVGRVSSMHKIVGSINGTT